MQVRARYSEIWAIAWPIILSSLANTVINFTDVAFLARIGENELAASALGGVFYFLLIMVGIALGVGITILVARKDGENKTHEVGNIYDHGLIILSICSLVILLLLYTSLPLLMHLVIKDLVVADLCIEYVNTRGIGLFFMMILVSIRALFTGIANTKIITYTTIVMMLLNVLLNYIFMYWDLGIKPLGIFGVALASAISEIVATLYAIFYTYFNISLKKYNLLRFKKINFTTAFNIIKISSPIILQHVIAMVAWLIFFLMIEKMGTHELAVSNVVRGIYMVLMTPIWGFSQAANSMVSNFIGQNRKDEILYLVSKIVKLSVVIGTAFTLIMFLFPEPIFMLSTNDPDILKSGYGSFQITCIANVIFSASMVLLSAVSGTGNTKAAMFIEIINISIYLLYVYIFTIVIPSSVEVVWGCEIIYWLLMATFSYIYLKSGKWKKLNLK